MTYYCTNCEKYHSDKFYKHFKYKKVNIKSISDPVELVKIKEAQDEVFKMIDDLAESEPQAFVNSHEIAGLRLRIKKLETGLDQIGEAGILTVYDQEDQYNDIIKLKKDLDLTDEVAQSQQNRFQELDEKIAKLEKKLDTIIGILIQWKVFVDRKHPYKHTYDPLFADL